MADHDDLEIIDRIINAAQVASVTTRRSDGCLYSRPLAVLKHDFEGTVWFFTQDPSAKTTDIAHDPQVNVAYADSKGHLSLVGTASIERDQERIDEFWSPFAEAYFPDGRHDPTVALLRVDATSAEYWENDKPAIARGLSVVRALVTGTTPDPGPNKKVDL